MYNYSTSSGLQTTSKVIYPGRGALAGIDVTAPGTGSVTVLIYDASSAISGKEISELVVDAGFISLPHEYAPPVGFNNGLYVQITQSGGTGASYICRFIPG